MPRPKSRLFIATVRLLEPLPWRYRVDIAVVSHFAASYAAACVRMIVTTLPNSPILLYNTRSILSFIGAALLSPILIPFEIMDRAAHGVYSSVAILFAPYLAAFLISLIWLKWKLVARRQYRADLGLCPVCGYDLTGSRRRCPECGHDCT